MHLYNCKFDDLILLVSLDFKTLWKMFTQRGGIELGQLLEQHHMGF